MGMTAQLLARCTEFKMDKPLKPEGMNGDYLHLYSLIEWVSEDVRELRGDLNKVKYIVIGAAITVIGLLLALLVQV